MPLLRVDDLGRATATGGHDHAEQRQAERDLVGDQLRRRAHRAEERVLRAATPSRRAPARRRRARRRRTTRGRRSRRRCRRGRTCRPRRPAGPNGMIASVATAVKIEITGAIAIIHGTAVAGATAPSTAASARRRAAAAGRTGPTRFGPRRAWKRPRSLRSSSRMIGTTWSTKAKIRSAFTIWTSVRSDVVDVGERQRASRLAHLHRRGAPFVRARRVVLARALDQEDAARRHAPSRTRDSAARWCRSPPPRPRRRARRRGARRRRARARALLRLEEAQHGRVARLAAGPERAARCPAAGPSGAAAGGVSSVGRGQRRRRERRRRPRAPASARRGRRSPRASARCRTARAGDQLRRRPCGRAPSSGAPEAARSARRAPPAGAHLAGRPIAWRTRWRRPSGWVTVPSFSAYDSAGKTTFGVLVERLGHEVGEGDRRVSAPLERALPGLRSGWVRTGSA